MALSNISNQPISFTSDPQTCLNNDLTTYKALVQAGDTIKVQLINEPCGGELLCSNTADELGANLVTNGTFDDIDDWTFVSGGDIGDGVLVLTNDDIVSQTINVTECATSVFNYYYFEFDITYVSGTPSFVLSDGGVNIWYSAAAVVGSYSGYAVSYFAGTTNSFDLTLTCDTGEVHIDNVVVKKVNDCCFMTELIDEVDYDPAWTFDIVAGYGEFTHVTGNTKTIYMPLSASYDTFRITYRIKNCTAGSVRPLMDTTYGTARSADGYYDENITLPGVHDTLRFEPTSDFNGTLYDFSVTHYNTGHRYDIVRIDQGSSDVVSDELTPEYVGDRLDIIYDPENNIFEGETVPLVTGCYRIRVYDECLEDVEPSIVSTTVFHYTTDTHDCTVLVDASCDGQALGFNFDGNFTLVQRLKLLRFGAKYKNSGTDADGSDGTKRKAYAKSQKVYTALFNYVDENAHDAINAQMNCDDLTLDGVEYFAPVQDIEPDYGPRGKRNLAQVEIELQKKESVLYNRNNI